MKLNTAFFKKNMFNLTFAQVGLDIGNFSVKIAQIKKGPLPGRGGLSFAFAPIQGNKTQGRVSEAIRQAFRSLAIDSNKVNLSISGPNIIMRYIILPVMKEADLAKSLEFELEKYIPYKKEDAIIDHCILSRITHNQMIVLLVAAELKLIQERINLIKDAGLEPQLINVDALALTEAFREVSPHPKGVVAILDIGYCLSKLVVLENGVPYFSRDIEIGEYDIAQMISEKINIDFALAKELAYNPEDRLKEITEVAKFELNSLLNELSLSFEYCERNLEKTVSQLYLCGGGSKVKIILDFLEKIPNLKISLWDTMQGFKISSSHKAQELEKYGSLMGVAIGLALS